MTDEAVIIPFISKLSILTRPEVVKLNNSIMSDDWMLLAVFIFHIKTKRIGLGQRLKHQAKKQGNTTSFR